MMQAGRILQKLERVKAKFDNPAYPEDKETVGAWESSVKRALQYQGLKDNEGIRKIIERGKSEIAEIDFVLLNDETLTVEQRKPLIRIKKFYQWFLGLFSEADETVREVEKLLDNELK